MVRPKKHLGQHFLSDNNIAAKIVDCLENENTDVVELGPGTGVLTKLLLSKQPYIKKLILIEIDNESVEFLNDNFNDDRLIIKEEDFLKTDVNKITDGPFNLIGNFPYNISSQIFFKVLENRNKIPQIVGMIQKEVADRIAEKNGTKTYGILSVLLQTWYDIEYCFTVSETVFIPPPKVKSAVIKLTRNNVQQLECDEKLFFKVVKMAFNQRRKTIRNSLKAIIPDISQDDHPYFSKRPEQLSPSDFVELTKVVEEIKGNQISDKSL